MCETDGGARVHFDLAKKAVMGGKWILLRGLTVKKYLSRCLGVM